MQEMQIDSIRLSLLNNQRVVILKEKTSDRYLPIWIGPAEAESIAIKLQDMATPRPLTHDLLNLVIASLGGEVSHIVVYDLMDDTFYANIHIRVNGNTHEIDCRPSDAIALAVRHGYFLIDPEGRKQYFDALSEAEAFVTNQRKYDPDYAPEIKKVCPIFVEETVLDKAGVALDKETNRPFATGSDVNGEEKEQMTEEDLKKMSAFKEFIGGLDLEDFERKRS